MMAFCSIEISNIELFEQLLVYIICMYEVILHNYNQLIWYTYTLPTKQQAGVV